ncbi:hypothetical protein B0A55_09950 [Friedmanniomyces simplex]|uniref:DNA 3'-5' helicase n=1 Tax=Friedmanniomyces simplex TaxID=329884 RepID=A0A4U0XDV7_9PEZI|nr:hypothetical protein B0A55_09950 [Friedmanniomyces simplex]
MNGPDTSSLTEATALSQLLDCGQYTGQKDRSDREKSAFLQRWTQDPEQPFLVATTALAEGFDYPHVRLVIIVDEPQNLIVFGQETGRIGREGQRAHAIVYLPGTWTPRAKHAGTFKMASSRYDRSLWEQQNQIAVQRFLSGEQCRRTCPGDDAACDVCQDAHEDAIPPIDQASTAGPTPHTGLDLIQQRQLCAQTELRSYHVDLAAVVDTCLRCRAVGDAWDHPLSRCAHRFDVIQHREEARARWKGRKQGRRRAWLPDYAACFWCCNPHTICGRADPSQSDGQGQACRRGDVVLPLCYGIFISLDGPQWLRREFDRHFNSVAAYFDWFGEETEFGGGKAIQGVRVAARMLREYSEPWEF